MTELLERYVISQGKVLEVMQGDITLMEVDAIVNAANNQLLHGGGVAAAISQRGGPSIQAESDAWVKKNGLVSHEKPAYTSAGNMLCKYVIHAVGPIWGLGDEDKNLCAAIEGSLRCAEELTLKSIAFPAISTGIYGFPIERAAPLTIETIINYYRENPKTTLALVRIVLFDQRALMQFTQALQKYISGS